MSAIGIDFARTSTVACLRDGDWPGCRWRPIGDSARIRIPNAIDGSGRWGSLAVGTNAPDLVGGHLSLDAGPWLGSPQAQAFLHSLATRLTAFLGRVEPTVKNGYRVVIAPETQSFDETASVIEGMCRRGAVSELDGGVCIPVQRALLCRWMAESRAEGSRTVVAVVVGDTLATAGAYEVEFGQAQRPEIVRCGAPHYLPGTGNAWWEQLVYEKIAERANAEIPAAQSLEVRDAILGMATRLRLGDRDCSIEWRGPLSDRMFQPLEIDRASMRNAREVLILSLQLPRIIGEALKSLGARADLVLLGGVGASWPFALEAIETAWQFGGVPVWQSANPLEDVARGAALWPMFAFGSRQILWTDRGDSSVEFAIGARAADDHQLDSTRTLTDDTPISQSSEPLLSRWTRRAPLLSGAPEEDL